MIDLNSSVKDFDFCMSKYSEFDFSNFYIEYLEMKKYIDSLPLSVRKSKSLVGDDKNYVEMAKIYNSLKSGSSTTCLFRKSNKSNDLLITSWLSSVTRKAQLVNASGIVPKFSGLDRETIVDIAKLSIDEDSVTNLPRFLIKYGIILIYEESILKMKLDGAVYKNETGNPVIGISFRFNRLDNFWFTLLHELSHVCLHYDALDQVILDDLKVESDCDIEIEANRLATDCIVSRSVWRSSSVRRNPSYDEVLKFANSIGVHPAIIAGKVQYEMDDYKILRAIVDKVDVRNKVFG